MKITRLHIKNIKCLKELDLAVPPEAPVVYITGPNGSGKTATLDSILYALAGKGKIPEGIIRNGQAKALIEITLDDGSKIKRAITGGNAYLTFTKPDGAEAASPQKLLDELVGPITLDPWSFCRSAAKDRRAMILAAAGKPDEIAAADGVYRDAFEERTLRKRALKQAEVLASEAPPLDPKIAGKEAVDVAPMRAALRVLQDNETRRERILGRVGNLEQMIAEAKKNIATWEKEQEAQLVEAKAIPAGDTAAAHADIAAAEDLNRLIAESAEARLRADELARCSAAVVEIEARVAAAEAARKGLLSEVAGKLPIEDLDIDDNEILVAGIPFNNLSTAQQLKLAIAIATASDPGLRIIRVTDGSLLDSASRAFLDKIATDLSLQIWIEDVRETGGAGIELTTEG